MTPFLLYLDPAQWALAVTSLIFVVGFFSTFLPILPGPVIIWAAIVLHKLWMGPLSISWSAVLAATGLTIITLVADLLCTVWGARRFGASWRGAGGAIFGGVLALFIPPQLLTLILFPFLGAIAAEFLGGAQPRAALRAGSGTVIGGMVALALKIALAITMIIGFYLLLP